MNAKEGRSKDGASAGRVVLFDIDGTLLDTHGLGRAAFAEGLERATGVPDDLAYITFAGNTDRHVLEEVMVHRRVRFDDASVERIFTEVAEALERRLKECPGRALTGARALLEALEAAGVRAGLATGNIQACAWRKVASAGLDRYFSFGGFGDAFSDRADIVRAAMAAGGGEETEGARPLCLIGDTPLDVAAGRACGVRVLGVASGRYDEASLRRAGADWAARDFRNTGEWLEQIVKTAE